MSASLCLHKERRRGRGTRERDDWREEINPAGVAIQLPLFSLLVLLLLFLFMPLFFSPPHLCFLPLFSSSLSLPLSLCLWVWPSLILNGLGAVCLWDKLICSGSFREQCHFTPPPPPSTLYVIWGSMQQNVSACVWECVYKCVFVCALIC